MGAVPVAPFGGTKNTTLHELQTGDGSRAADRNPDGDCQSTRGGTM